MSEPLPALDFRNVNSLWCGVLVETLVRCGVRSAVICPGSRSAPLTFALARHPRMAAVPVLDERSAGFFALGLAKRTQRPVLLVCTSGTAAANFFPAVIEAHESGVPLLVITADRPPEMRACASGQTIDQQKLYGGYAVFYHELAVPEARLEQLRYLRQTIAHACARALDGPAQLNAPFRDPLPPVEDGSAAGLRGQIDEAFFSHLTPPERVKPGIVSWTRPATARGLIVAGPHTAGDAAAYAGAVIRLAEKLGWPVLADALSPLRHHARSAAAVVTAYDAVLRDETAARALWPQAVICLGGWPTSKVLRGWLERSGAEITLVAEGAANRDALHGRTRHLPLRVECLDVAGTPAADPGYRETWRAAETAARAQLDGALENTGALFEGKAAWLLAKLLPEETAIFVASSMPVRDAEYFWPADNRRLQPFFNRGANGIDGTLSTALGIAHGRPPAVLLTGDLALLHDANGFLIAPKFRGSLTIVLINNQGGGIFEHLAVAKFDPPFEEFFATPQRVDFGRLCAAHDVEHIPVRDWAHFSELVSALPAEGIRVLEVRTDRKQDAATRKALFEAAAKAAEKTRSG